MFSATTPSTGREVFSIALAAGGSPEILVDARPGVEEGQAVLLGVAGEQAVFVVFGAPASTWVTDGTAVGTHLLLPPGQDPIPEIFGLLPADVREVGDRVLFTASSGELWSTDGTEAGTTLLATTEFGWLSPRPFAKVGTEVWFVSRHDDPFRRELWATGGTPASTTLLTQLPVDPEGGLFSLGDRVCFFGASDRELWVSDGTPAGTLQLTDSIASNPLPEGDVSLVALGRLVFRFDDGVHGEELWSSDGSLAGTIRLTDIVSGGLDSQVSRAATAGGRVVYLAYDSLGELQVRSVPIAGGAEVILEGLCVHPDCGIFRMWLVQAGGKVVFPAEGEASGGQIHATDGTVEGTERLGDLPVDFAGSIHRPLEIDDLAVFRGWTESDGQEVWVTDGTDAGTRPITAFEHPSALTMSQVNDPLRVLHAGGRFWVGAYAAESGSELWTTDGDPTSTALAADVGLDLPGSDPASPTFASNRFVFLAANGITWDAWRSDGTSEGTVAVGLPPGQPANDEIDRATLPVGDRVLVSWIDDGPFEQEIYAVDAATGGVTQLTVDPAHDVESPPYRFRNGAAFFTRIDGRLRLWISGGTPATTRQVSSLPVGTHWADYAVDLDGLLYFVAHDVDGPDVWRSDGTPSGTFPLGVDRLPGLQLFDDPGFFRAGDYAFFRADSNLPAMIIRTNGSEASTAVFLGGDTGAPGVHAVLPFRGEIYFFGYSDAQLPEVFSLMRTSPEIADPELVASFAPAIGGVAEVVATGTRMLMSMWTDFGGRELWVSDGTEAGTSRIDMTPPYRYPEPSDLTVVGDRFYFTATDDVHGLELWTSDGTEQGTTLVADIAPGGVSSRTGKLFYADCRLFFVADDTQSGLEPWMIDFDVCPGLVFSDGFESGDTSAWSGSTP